MSFAGRYSSRQGWSLTWHRDHWGSWSSWIPGDSVLPFIAGPPRITLDGLHVTYDEAQQLMSVLSDRCCLSLRTPAFGGSPGFLVADGIELTMAEAELIRQGMDPLMLLLPGLTVRSLTGAELLAGMTGEA